MLTVSIVTYHTELRELQTCLESLDSDCVYKIYIIDHGNEERIRRFCASYPKIEYSARPNLGYGIGHNFAIRRAMALGSDYHLVLNSDVRFDPSILNKATKFMDNNPDVGLLHPSVFYANGETQYTVRYLPTPLDVFGRRFLPKWCFKRRNERYTLQNIDRTQAYNVPYHQGSFMLFRSSTFNDVGLFDERYFMYGEDIDQSRRVHAMYKTLFWPEINIIHDHRAASYVNFKMLKIHIHNLILYFNKWGWFYDPQRRKFNKRLRKTLNTNNKQG